MTNEQIIRKMKDVLTKEELSTFFNACENYMYKTIFMMIWGNLYEWTLETDRALYRVLRGGNFSDSFSLSSSQSSNPYMNRADYGSRLTLYIL